MCFKWHLRIILFSDLNSEEDLDEDINEVEDRLYISSGKTAHCLETLKKYKITHIVNVTHDLANKYDEDGIKFTYVRFPVDDFASENLSVYFTKGVKFIEDALSENTTNVVLVH